MKITFPNNSLLMLFIDFSVDSVLNLTMMIAQDTLMQELGSISESYHGQKRAFIKSGSHFHQVLKSLVSRNYCLKMLT